MMKLSGSIYIWKEPVLTMSQFARLSNICDNIGTVFVAVGVVSPLFAAIDTTDWRVIVGGGFCATILFSTSVYLAKKGNGYE